VIDFSLARLPRIEFGDGKIACLPSLIQQYGSRTLLVTGKASFCQTHHWRELIDALQKLDIEWHHVAIEGEPLASDMDAICQRYRPRQIQSVVGIGGGSALDAAKSIAGLLPLPNSVMDFLEGVGPELRYQGPSLPLIAVPTTAGTGSEATKNAVLSSHGEQAFKKSFRDEKLVAQYAVIDPSLLASCTAEIVAANGMDALTQLIESYVSIKANTFSDALVISGLRAARDGLLVSYGHAGEAHHTASQEVKSARSNMAYAALISGISLAQVGLGSVHGLASPLGAFYPVPHGVVCGTLVATATQVNIQAMRQREPDNTALSRYARIAEVLCERRIRDASQAHDALIDLLGQWTETMRLPRLAQYGVTADGIARVVKNSRGSSMKTNPIVLRDDEIASIVEHRL